MSVAFGSPLTSANTNAAFVSRTQDSDMQGKLDQLNATDSSSVSTGSVTLAGGLGVAKKAYINRAFLTSYAGQFALMSSPSKELVESPVTSTELGYLSGVTSSIQNQLNLKANDTDVVHNTRNETIAGIKTFTSDTNFNQDVVIDGDLTVNGTTTTINTTTLDVTDVNITVNKAGNNALSEGAGLTVDRTGTKGSFIYANALTSRFKLGDLGSESEVITAAGVQTLSGDKTLSNATFNGSLKAFETINSTLTGASANLPTPTPTIRLTNVSLSSISTIDDLENGKLVLITNSTGVNVTINNEVGSPATNRITVPSGANLILKNNESIIVSYDSNTSRWKIISGSGSSSGRAGVTALATNDQSKTITFSTDIGTSTYSVVPSIENSVDTDDFIWLQWKILNKTSTGFDIEFNLPVNSNNYSVNWKADLYV